jgi:hypothetical protein
MYNLEDILTAYRRQVQLRWALDVSAGERVWLLWYDKALDRKVRMHAPELEQITNAANHGWRTLDLANSFGRWIAQHSYFDALLTDPAELASLAPEFERHLTDMVMAELDAASANDVVAIFSAASLFGIARVSRLIEQVAPAIKGRLLVTFPGRHASGVYRLLDARDGWNYRAIAIPSQSMV